jgi:DME family drug/metabolite transporter
MTTHTPSLHGQLAILLACFLWGTTGIASSFAPDVSPLAVGAFSMGVGGLLQTLVSMRLLKRDIGKIRALPLAWCLGGLGVVIYPLAFYSAMRYSGVAVGNVVSLASAPFFTVLLECLISKRVPSRLWVSSLMIGVVGITLLAMNKGASSVHSEETVHLLGVGLGLLAGLSYGVYSFVAKTMIDANIDSRAAMASLFAGASVILLPSLWFTGENLFATSTNASSVLYIAFLPMFIGYLAFGYGLRTVAASQATLMTLLEPVIAASLAVWLLGEVINLPGWVGMGLILLCLVLQSRKSKAPKGKGASQQGLV